MQPGLQNIAYSARTVLGLGTLQSGSIYAKLEVSLRPPSGYHGRQSDLAHSLTGWLESVGLALLPTGRDYSMAPPFFQPLAPGFEGQGSVQRVRHMVPGPLCCRQLRTRACPI